MQTWNKDDPYWKPSQTSTPAVQNLLVLKYKRWNNSSDTQLAQATEKNTGQRFMIRWPLKQKRVNSGLKANLRPLYIVFQRRIIPPVMKANLIWNLNTNVDINIQNKRLIRIILCRNNLSTKE